MKYFPTFLCLSIFVLSACAQDKPTIQNKDTFSIQKTEKEWKEILSEDQYYVLREKGTEKPGTGKFLFHKEKGYYTCAGCGNKLFKSDAKFDSHCGWPSFDEQLNEKTIVTKDDNSFGMKRTEILCAKCGGHLGHLFDDGPTETGLRYCVNSLSLSFEPAVKETKKLDTLVLGGGCFWCIEAVFEAVNGVESVKSAYAGGKMKTVSYEEVCSGRTNFAEVVQIVYDSNKVQLTQLLKVFFKVHNPTTLNRQGADVGTQYRSVIFYSNDAQKKTAEKVIATLTSNKVYDAKIVTELSPLTNFVMAEEYHQDYFEKHPDNAYCQAVIQPKMASFEKAFAELLKK